MKIDQKNFIKILLFFLIIILGIKKCENLVENNETIAEKPENDVVVSKEEEQKEKGVLQAEGKEASEKEENEQRKQDELVSVSEENGQKEILLDNALLSIDEDKNIDINTNQNIYIANGENEISKISEEKFIPPKIEEEIEVLFSQGYEYAGDNSVLKQGEILASIDPITTKPKLDIIGNRSLRKNDLFFYIYSNYLMYIDSGEIEIYGDRQGREKLGTIVLEEIKLKNKYEITLNPKYNDLKKVYYKLVVRDKNDKKDETEIKELDLTLNVGEGRENDEDIIEKIYDTSSLKVHHIPIDFYKVRFYGKGFEENNKVVLEGQEMTLDEVGNFVHEAYYFPGQYDLNFKVYEVNEYELEKTVRTPEEIQSGEYSEEDSLFKEKVVEKGDRNTQVVEIGIPEDREESGVKEFVTEDGVIVTIDGEKRTEKKYVYSYPVEVFIDENYHFLVGIADVKIGRNRVEKESELLLQNSEYDEGMFDEGRLAFYTRNKIGKYSIVAQMDTENQEIKHIFDGLGKRDNREIFKDMKREDKGYTFGDDSYSMMDVESQGQFYLRVEWDKNKTMWGNYSSSIDNGEYLSYSKALYGAQFTGASQETTSYNEDRYSGTLFFSNPETMTEYNIFLATGGSLYYLKNRDLVEGSEEVVIEVINERTGQKVKEVSLSEGEDYAINNIQGRIILNEPLFQYGYKEIGDVIKDSPISDYKTYLKVQYEYYDRNGLYSSDYTTGGSGKYWINDSIQIGAAYVKSTELEEKYELKGLSGVIRKSENTYLEWEYAQSEGKKFGRGFYSSTGGLNFRDINYIDRDEDSDENFQNSGDAYQIRGVLSLNELSNVFTEGSMAEFWYNKKDGGFSIDSLDDGSTDTEYGFKSDYIVNERFFLTTEYSRTESENEGEKDIEQEIAVQGTYAVSDKMAVAVAVRGSDNNEDGESSSDNDGGGYFTEDGYESDGVGKSIDVGVTVNYQFTDDTSGYVGVQKAVSTDKIDTNDIMGSVGGSTKLFDKLTLTGDYAVGNEESAGIIQAAYAISESYEAYVNLEQERMIDGTSNDISFGQKVLIGNKYEVFQENQLSKDSDSNEELTQVYGLNINLTEELKIGIGYEQGDLDEKDGKSKRNSLSTNLYYDDRKKWKYNNRLEMIKDKGNEDYTIEWLTVNDVKYKYNEEWTAVGKLDFSITEDKINGGYESKFMELGIGGAYRPIWNDRLNMLWKYTYLYDLNGVDEDEDYSFGDFDERSSIFSFDAVYSLTKKIDIGGKWAYKKAEMKAANDEDEWFSAETTLYAVSLSYNFYKNWRVSGEYHWLISDTDNEKKEGAMVGIDYDIHENLRVGIGYNFTDFSDDLRYDDYKANGVYISIIGRF